jgi:hypothetical protein
MAPALGPAGVLLFLFAGPTVNRWDPSPPQGFAFDVNLHSHRMPTIKNLDDFYVNITAASSKYLINLWAGNPNALADC